MSSFLYYFLHKDQRDYDLSTDDIIPCHNAREGE